MGVEIEVNDLSKSFGKQLIWGDVTLTIPAGEICVMLGPSGTGKSVFLKTLIGLLKPDKGSILIEGTDIASCSERELYEIRKLFGVLFQDGAMFGSMNLYDNVAFPLREHTKKSEREIKDIVLEKMELTGLTGAEEEPDGDERGQSLRRTRQHGERRPPQHDAREHAPGTAAVTHHAGRNFEETVGKREHPRDPSPPDRVDPKVVLHARSRHRDADPIDIGDGKQEDEQTHDAATVARDTRQVG